MFDVMLSSTKKNSFRSSSDLGDLRDDFVDGAARLSGIENRLHRAKITFEMTAASGLNQPDWQITFAAKDGAVGFQSGQRGAIGLAVKFLQPTVPCIINHARPESFGFADNDGFGVLRDFIRAKRGVEIRP